MGQNKMIRYDNDVSVLKEIKILKNMKATYMPHISKLT